MHQWLHHSWILVKSLLREAATAGLSARLLACEQEQLPVWSYLHRQIVCSQPVQTFFWYIGTIMSIHFCFTVHPHIQYGFFFLGSNIHLWHFCTVNSPSVNVRQILNLCTFLSNCQSPRCFKRMQFKLNFLCTIEPWGVDHARFNKPYKLHFE